MKKNILINNILPIFLIFIMGIVCMISLKAFYRNNIIEIVTNDLYKRDVTHCVQTKKVQISDLIDISNDTFVSKKLSANPIILGFEYVDTYKIGDIINNMPQKDINSTYKVIAFLKKDSSVSVNDELIFLDRYIISPSLTILKKPETINEMMYQGFLYLQKTNGVVKLSESYELQEFLSDLEIQRIKYNIFEIGILDYSMLEINTLTLLVYENIKILFILALVMFLFNISSIISYIIITVNSSLYTYKVYLLSGYSIEEIKKSVWYQIFFLIFIPIIISIVIISLFLVEFLLTLFMFNIFIFFTLIICSTIFLNIYFKNITMDRLIKGDYND